MFMFFYRGEQERQRVSLKPIVVGRASLFLSHSFFVTDGFCYEKKEKRGLPGENLSSLLEQLSLLNPWDPRWLFFIVNR